MNHNAAELATVSKAHPTRMKVLFDGWISLHQETRGLAVEVCQFAEDLVLKHEVINVWHVFLQLLIVIEPAAYDHHSAIDSDFDAKTLVGTLTHAEGAVRRQRWRNH